MARGLNGRAALGVPMVALFALAALVGPWVAPYGLRAIDLAHELAPPSAAHPFGTGENGADVLSGYKETNAPGCRDPSAPPPADGSHKDFLVNSRGAARSVPVRGAVMLDWRVFGSARDTGAFFLPLTLRMFFGGDAPEAAAGVAGALVALALDATLGAAALEGSADS